MREGGRDGECNTKKKATLQVVINVNYRKEISG